MSVPLFCSSWPILDSLKSRAAVWGPSGGSLQRSDDLNRNRVCRPPVKVLTHALSHENHRSARLPESPETHMHGLVHKLASANHPQLSFHTENELYNCTLTPCTCKKTCSHPSLSRSVLLQIFWQIWKGRSIAVATPSVTLRTWRPKHYKTNE